MHFHTSSVCRTCFLLTPVWSDYWKNTVVCISSRKPAEATNLRQQPHCSADSVGRTDPIILFILMEIWKFTMWPTFSESDSGLRQALKKQLAAELRGNRKFAWHNQDNVWCLAPLGSEAKLYRHDQKSVSVGRHMGAIMWGRHLTLTCSPQSSLKASLSCIV